MRKIPLSENETTEFKECSGKKRASLPNDLWQSIAAFSNSHRGNIYLGVRDDGKIIGISSTDLDKLQKDLSTMLNNNFFNVKPRVAMNIVDRCLEIAVTELEFYNKPIYSRKVGPKQIWIRQGSTNVRASDEEMRSLFAGATGGGENQIVSSPITELIDELKVDDYIKNTGLQSIEIKDLYQKMAKIKSARDGMATIFGLIAFGKNEAIDEKLNNVYIDFKIFSGTTKVDSENINKIYSERKEFHGDVKTQFLQAFEYIKRKLPSGATLNSTTGLRENAYILPEDALREALANAIAHRDYLLQSSCINIDLYADRIEISNPGESLVSLEDLERTASKARNPNLMEFLKTYNITDKTARGIPIIYQATRIRGLLDPKFENISGCFKATLYFSSTHTNEDKIWVEKISEQFSLKDTQKNALVFIKNQDSISNKQYCDINHMNQRNDDRRARRELNELKKIGIIKTTGAGAGTRYILSGQNPDKIRTK